MNIGIVDIKNKEIEKFDLNFDDNVEINRKAISQVVKWQLSKRRSGTASTKNRAMVNASNKKPFKQKGTGNARAGSRTSPIWRGGGVIFGPTPKDWSINVPKKIKKLALFHSVLYKLKQETITVVDVIDLKSHKTKDLISLLKPFKLADKLLIVSDTESENINLASRNIEKLKLIKSEGVNVYDLLNYKSILIDKATLTTLVERLK
ncbi:50S ribosomal protein L4 [bacterium]|jgi:large subunit ribosomal protein L4|nr:50S ribosomal protein L4 [bacterium]MBT3795639.1 50S ribosomal protein L4 [bacterium]MBT4634154.1 50S ribosomal protein L4 [bacterium]